MSNIKKKPMVLKHWDKITYHNGSSATWYNNDSTSTDTHIITYPILTTDTKPVWEDWGNDTQKPQPTHFVCPNCLGIFPIKDEIIIDVGKRKLSFCCEKCCKEFDMSKLVPMEI